MVRSKVNSLGSAAVALRDGTDPSLTSSLPFSPRFIVIVPSPSALPAMVRDPIRRPKWRLSSLPLSNIIAVNESMVGDAGPLIAAVMRCSAMLLLEMW